MLALWLTLLALLATPLDAYVLPAHARAPPRCAAAIMSEAAAEGPLPEKEPKRKPTLYADEQKRERETAYDLLDAITRYGALTVDQPMASF